MRQLLTLIILLMSHAISATTGLEFTVRSAAVGTPSLTVLNADGSVALALHRPTSLT